MNSFRVCLRSSVKDNERHNTGIYCPTKVPNWNIGKIDLKPYSRSTLINRTFIKYGVSPFLPLS